MEHDSSFNIQLRTKNSFDFAENVEKQKEDNQIDLDVLFDLAEENKIMYNHVPVNSLIEDLADW